MNEELTLAIDELRQRPTSRAWFIPVLLSKCEVPDRNIGAGQTLRDIERLDLSENWSAGLDQLFEVIQPDSVRRRRKKWLAADLCHLIGELVGQNEWATTSPSEAGYLVYGQYESLESGEYAAVFRLKIDDNVAQSTSDRVARIDVSSNTGKRTIARQAVKRSDFVFSNCYQDIALPFELKNKEDNVEMRVSCTGKAGITAAAIELWSRGR